VVAYDGITALEKVKKLSNLSLILLDIGIPGIDGFEVLRRLRINPATKRIPIIMLSCRTDTPSIFAAKGLKATDYIIKTMEFEKMLPILKRHLDKDKIKPIDI
jgi:DNA-binding response OmpR family regulator